MKPKAHHKPRNVTLTKIARLSKGSMNFPYVRDNATTRAPDGFEVSQAALMRIRAGLV